jgi:manganese-dependent inorganic pyrophosphatase
MLPVVNALGVYQGMLHYRRFAEYVITHINPHSRASFPVSIEHLTETLRAQPLVLFDEKRVEEASIVIAASYNRYFTAHLPHPEHSLVIMGDRFDLQEFCIRAKVRALILSGGHTLAENLLPLARENQVSVLSSPYDTASTAALVMYSTPVKSMADTSVPLVRDTDTVKAIREPLSAAPSRCLPIGDAEGRVEGLLFAGDLLEEPRIRLILVDHNEPSQAIEGVENYHILEVIDHHRLGNLSTRYPITFINKPVGATATIITGLYREARAPMRRETASILLCGILADTMNLKSATTTDTDREAARYLSEATGLDIAALAADLLQAGSAINTYKADKLVSMDMKVYEEDGKRYSVSQIETTDASGLLARKVEIRDALKAACEAKELTFAGLLVTDVTRLDSLLIVTAAQNAGVNLNFPKQEENVYILKGIVSRKKQLIPLLSEMIEKS